MEYIALFNAWEESSLYEIPSELRRLISDSPDLVPLCQQAVLNLLQHGFVCLYDDSRHRDVLDRGQAEALVASDSAWQVPQVGAPDIYLVITDTGIEAMHKYPGISKRRQRCLADALMYGPYGTEFPYGLSEESRRGIFLGALDTVHKLSEGPASFLRFCTWSGRVLGRGLRKLRDIL